MRAEEKMNVVGHDGEVVQADLRLIVLESFQKKSRPWLVAKEALAAS